MEFDDILRSVGEFGRYQKRLVIFYLIPTTIIFSFYAMNTFFMLSAPDAWCSVPELAQLPAEQQQRLARPPLAGHGDGLKFDSCHYYDLNYTSLVDKLRLNISLKADTKIGVSSNATLLKCDSWTYDKSNFDATAVTYMNLVCDRSHWVAMIYTVHGIGEVVGNPVFGSLSDKFGRKLSFFITLVMALSTSTSPILFKGLYIFMVTRFLISATAASLVDLPFTIRAGYRTRLVGVNVTCWTVGMCILPYVAYLTRDWITLTIIPTILVLPIFCCWKILPESPRWLLSTGRFQEAYDIMANIATVNGRPVPKDLMEHLQAVTKKEQYGAISSQNTIFDILRRPGLRFKFVLITLSWTANITAYRGITLMFQNFEGSEFINWFLLAVVELPSNLLSWYLMNTRLGRRWSNSLTMSLGGLSLCIPLLLPPAWTRATLVAVLFGKFLCNMAHNVVYMQTLELFPTPVRNQGLSFSSAIGMGANFALPYLTCLGKFRVWLPLLLMGGICVTSGVAAAFLPETLYENLPQSIDDGDQFVTRKKFWAMAKRRPEVVGGDTIKMTVLDSDSYRKVASNDPIE